MDEYVADVATWYQSNAKMLEIAEKKLEVFCQFEIRPEDWRVDGLEGALRSDDQICG